MLQMLTCRSIAYNLLLPIYYFANMKQQTAVEWLWNLSLTKELQASDFQQALAMEKEQIIDAYNNGENRSAELYYNETYGGDK
jgi:hypothetical protein